VDEFVKWNDRVLQEVISPIQNKVGQFLSSSLIRNIVGQTKSAFNIRDIMDEGKIIIMNLSKGRIGEDNSALLGAMMITKIQLAAMARVDVPEDERRDFYLYVDEFQNFATDSFSNILSEARKYHLNLVIAHQYIGQLITDTSTRVRDAVFGNVGTLCVFRIGAEDAEFLEKEFEPVFMTQDLVNLPNRNIYIKLMIDGIAGNAFSAETLPPASLAETEENAEKVIRVTRERYATPRDIVEEKIARWSGLIPEKELVPVERRAPARPPVRVDAPRTRENIKIPQKVADPNRPMYPAKCATCDTDIQVPFQPDGSRPTFCKDCLKDYQRQQARLQSSPRQRPARTGTEAPIQTRLREGSERRREISLSQATRMSPRPFKNNREKPRKQVNLTEVRELIKESLETKKT
jgi:CxxC-x17-CxxC domain-containing protein